MQKGTFGVSVLANHGSYLGTSSDDLNVDFLSSSSFEGELEEWVPDFVVC